MLFATLLVVVFSAPGVVAIVGRLNAGAALWTAAGSTCLAFALGVAAWTGGSSEHTVDWIPAWHVALRFRYDGLAGLYTLLATGIGTVVLLFATEYMPRHFRRAPQPERLLARFSVLMSLFVAAMVGLVTSRELYSLTIFWDITAVASFLLIATDWTDDEAREAAQLAAVLTIGSAVLLLVAVVVTHSVVGTTDLDRVLSAVRNPGSIGAGTLDIIVALIALAALTKSAQVPFHFWLPRAMVAPTPVSAYLHSAAMVAAGVFLLSLLHPLTARSHLGPLLLSTVGASSIAVGSALAMTASGLKQVLAYSTIAQYGYIVLMLGLGGEAAASGAAYYVLAHAVAKSGLFMTAGAVTEALEGETDLGKMGGLLRSMTPWAVASGVCAATLAGLPLTLGYFKDELFFKTAFDSSPLAAAFAVMSAALTLAYTWRFWSGIFLGPSSPRHLGHVLSPLPVVVLACAAVIGGIANAPYAAVAEGAARVIREHIAPVPSYLTPHLSPESLLALGAYAVGLLLVLARRHDGNPWQALQRAGERLGPRRLYESWSGAATRFGRILHDREIRDLRGRVAAVLLPGAFIIGLALPALLDTGTLRVGVLRATDVPLLCALVLSALAAVGSTRPSRHVTLILASSLVTYALAAVFVLLGAPDVALVTVVVQTAVSLLILAMLSLFPTVLLRSATRLASPSRRGAVIAITAALGAFVVSWATLSRPAGDALPQAYLALAPTAHAQDVVTGILADFRGLDTVGESVVLTVALLGLATLLLDRWRHA